MTIDEKIGNTLGVIGLVMVPIVIALIIYLHKKAELGGEVMRGRGFGRGFGQARQGQDRGRGVPREDIERAMRHYNISREEYLAHTEAYPLPPRGAGL